MQKGEREMTAPTTGERLIRVEVIMEEFRKETREALARIEKKQERFDERLADAETTIATAKVGWKTLVTIGGFLLTVAGAVGAFVAQYLPFFGAAPR
jgi:hypothetical protein